MKNLKRRFFDKDFNDNKVDKDDVIVDMNDLKKVFREWIINRIEDDMESIVKLYFENYNNKSLTKKR